MRAGLSKSAELALGVLGDGSRLLEVARRLSDAGAGPILGGVAVFLHGYRRTTGEIDVFSDDTQDAAARLESLGAIWDPARREHVLDGVPFHLVTAAQTGFTPGAGQDVAGVRIVSLRDLVTMKLASGLASIRRAQDLADVVGLIRDVPLDDTFAAGLPANLRAEFKRLVNATNQES